MSPGVLIRPYQPSDRKAVRHLCCETGYLGGRIDPVFEDRELFADYLTKYYIKTHDKTTNKNTLINIQPLYL